MWLRIEYEKRKRIKYPLSFYQRMTFPFYSLKILDDSNICNNAKTQFLERDAHVWYKNDPVYYDHEYCFCDENYAGYLDSKGKMNYLKEYNKKYNKRKTIDQIFYIPCYDYFSE